MTAPFWTDTIWVCPGANPQYETSSNNRNGYYAACRASALPTLEDQGWLQETIPLHQDLTSSVDLCQILPRPLIQHNRPTYLNSDDQISEEPYDTYLFGPNPCTTQNSESSHIHAEFISRENLNSEFDDFDFSFNSEFCENAGLSSASSTTTGTQPAPKSSPTAMSHQMPQPEDIRAKQLDKSKSMPQKGSSSIIFQCGKCFKSYPKRWQLNRHLKRYEKPFRCNSSGCNAAFALRKDHRRHMKQVHLGFASEEDILRCLFQTCTFSSTRRDALKRHLQGVHGVQISFEAPISPPAPKSSGRSEQLCI